MEKQILVANLKKFAFQRILKTKDDSQEVVAISQR